MPDDMPDDMPNNTPADAAIKAERAFLHDISTPLSIALGQIEMFLDESQVSGPALTEAQNTRLGKIHKAVDRIRLLVEERRAILRARS